MRKSVKGQKIGLDRKWFLGLFVFSLLRLKPESGDLYLYVSSYIRSYSKKFSISIRFCVLSRHLNFRFFLILILEKATF